MKHKHKKKVAYILKKKQIRLGNLINCTLQKSYTVTGTEEDRLCYYQGYHDVAAIFLGSLGGGKNLLPKMGETSSSSSIDSLASSMGLELPARVLMRISQSHLRDAMRANFLQLQSALRLILFPLIAVFDPEVHAQLYHADMEPYFCLSWIITWFSHDVRDTPLVKRLFDAFLVSHPLLPVYVSVAMILHSANRTSVLDAEFGDFASVHQALAHLPKNSCSMGWKYVGDGYMSGEEEDNGTVSTDDMDHSLVSNEEMLLDSMDEDMGSVDGSTISGPLIVVGRGEKVSFEELLDLAINFMYVVGIDFFCDMCIRICS